LLRHRDLLPVIIRLGNNARRSLGQRADEDLLAAVLLGGVLAEAAESIGLAAMVNNPEVRSHVSPWSLGITTFRALSPCLIVFRAHSSTLMLQVAAFEFASAVLAEMLPAMVALAVH
jgi:hypothetical protein